jgi:catechol 2,3-dioxygenase-like lactoylglutathione lyase family enzyme
VTTPPAARESVYELTPFLNVADVDASVRFYATFGFSVANSMGHDDHLHWAWLRSGPGGAAGTANLMIGTPDPTVNRAGHGVQFYLYTHDLSALRERLLREGIAAEEILYPEHLPNGEMRVADPDGYVVMVGQR